jgi:hypothetical protein
MTYQPSNLSATARGALCSLSAVLLLGLGVAVVLLARRRVAARPGGREETLRAARLATRQVSRDVRRTGRGTLRGQGGGGDAGLASDAAHGTDGGTSSGL